MLQNVIGITEIRLAEKNQRLLLEITSEFPHLMISDELRLSQVFTNLLTNASKFTPEDGEITIRIREEPYNESFSRLFVEIQDTGIGISPKNQKNLFQSFEQADGSITRTYGGTGLGLAICKKIVSLMGGNIWVESTEGVGSVFGFDVIVSWSEEFISAPLSDRVDASSQTRSSQFEADAVDWSSKTLLLVEDIEVNREIVLAILYDTGISVVECENGQIALDVFYADPERYALIMMDLQMPVLDGLSATRLLRANTEVPWAQQVPIVALTANAFKEDAMLCREAGMNEHIAKPFNSNELLEALSKYLDV